MNENYEQAKSAWNKRRQKAKTESSIRDWNINSIPNLKLPKELSLFRSEVDRDYFHWGTTAEIMEIKRSRRKSPETLRLVKKTAKYLPTWNNAPKV